MAAAANDPGARGASRGARCWPAPPSCGDQPPARGPCAAPRRSSLRLPLSLPGSFPSLATVTPTDSYGGRTCRLASLPGPAAQAPGILPSLSALAAIPRRREPASTLRVVGGRRRRRAGGPRRTGGHARGRRGRGRPREEVPTALGPVANRGRLGQLRGIWLANAIT